MRVPLPPGLVSILSGTLVVGLCRTWRYRTIGESNWAASWHGGRPSIYLMWHEAILPLLWQRRGGGISIVVSGARDGRYLSDFARRIGYDVVPGSSSRGGVRALVGAIRVLRGGGRVGITPDGPRGPRRELKPGFLTAAQRSGALVYPMHASASWARRMGSWDRFLLPLPGARVQVVVGEPFEVGAGPEGLERGLQCATDAMAAVVGEAEWRSGVATGTG